VKIANKFADYYKALSGPPIGVAKLIDMASDDDGLSTSQYECTKVY